MYTVVVADDEEEIRQALIRRVDWEEAGFRVVGEAGNGVEALELVERLEPDLLLSDVKMPFMSGLELARAVREIRPTMQIAFLSGYDDFSYAQQAIQYNIISYMLKPISAKEMTAELKKIAEKMDQRFAEFSEWTRRQENSGQESFFMSLLLDAYGDDTAEEREQTLRETAAEYGLLDHVSDPVLFAVMVLTMWDGMGKNRTVPGSTEAVDSILKKYVRHVSLYAEGRVVSLLAATKTGMNKYVHILVEDIAQSVKRITGLNTSIGVSRQIGALSGCHEAYMEAMDALSYCPRDESRVQFISDIQRPGVLEYEEIHNAVSTVENLIRGGSRQELEEYLESLFGRAWGEAAVLTELRLMLVQIEAAVFRVVYTVADQKAVWELQNGSPLQHQIFHEKPTEVKKRYIQFCVSAQNLVSEQRSRSGSLICDQALEIIERRYSDPDLSLVSISNEIAVTPNYLSTLIKKSTGHTFIELLTTKRIEVAKELLCGSALKIREIAEQCGYNDQHYFSYCFKRYTGQSPNASRRQNEEDKKKA